MNSRPVRDPVSNKKWNVVLCVPRMRVCVCLYAYSCTHMSPHMNIHTQKEQNKFVVFFFFGLSSSTYCKIKTKRRKGHGHFHQGMKGGGHLSGEQGGLMVASGGRAPGDQNTHSQDTSILFKKHHLCCIHKRRWRDPLPPLVP